MNDIKSDGAEFIGEALKTNSTVTQLDLSMMPSERNSVYLFIHLFFTNKYNSIGSDGTKAIAEALKTNTHITRINFENTQRFITEHANSN